METGTVGVVSGDVAALIRSHMIGLLPFERTNPKTITAANNQKNYKLTRAATLQETR